jgi:hypothetical protein
MLHSSDLGELPQDGCTNGCTSSAEIAHAVLSDADSKRLELLAADAELRAVVDGWTALPNAVRAGLLAMVRAAIGET